MTFLFLAFVLHLVAGLKYIHESTLEKPVNCKAVHDLTVHFSVDKDTITEKTVFRQECMLACINDQECVWGVEDEFLLLSFTEKSCVFGTTCVDYWGAETPPTYETAIEFWRVITQPSEMITYECGDTSQCTSSTYSNCCQSIYDRMPVCARPDSLHCQSETGHCVSGEHYCADLKGDVKCISDDFECPAKYGAVTPILICLSIFAITLISWGLQMWQKNLQAEQYAKMREPDTKSLYFVQYSRPEFMTEGVHFPDEGEPTFSYQYDVEDYLFPILNVTQSSLARAVIPALQLALLTLLLSWFHSYCRNADSGDTWSEDVFLATIGGLAYVLRVMETYISFLLVLILVNFMGWFSSVVTSFYKVQGGLTGLGLLVSAEPKMTKDDCFRAYRYLNLVHVYLHMCTTSFIQGCISDENLRDCGLLTEEEYEEIKDASDQQELALKWLAKAAVFSGQSQQAFRQLRGEINMSLCLINDPNPFSLLQLMMCLTYFYLILLPFSMYMAMIEGHDPNWSNVIRPDACFSTFLVGLFYLAILNLILNLSNPTGEDIDDVNTEALLIQTDKTLAMYLCGTRRHKSDATRVPFNQQVIGGVEMTSQDDYADFGE